VIALVLLKEAERDYPTNTAIKYFEKAKEEISPIREFR
jgi:hypothetical protein